MYIVILYNWVCWQIQEKQTQQRLSIFKLFMPISSSKYIKWDKQVDLIWQAERKMRNEKSPLFYRVVIWIINCIFTKTIHEFGFLKHRKHTALAFKVSQNVKPAVQSKSKSALYLLLSKEVHSNSCCLQESKQ